jgi:hypothetical protein
MEPADSNISEILQTARSDKDTAAAGVLRLAATPPKRQEFLSASLHHTLAKADEVHYYKYAAALLEDIRLVSADWKPHLAAAVLYYAKGPQDAEPLPMQRAREALRTAGARLPSPEA